MGETGYVHLGFLATPIRRERPFQVRFEETRVKSGAEKREQSRRGRIAVDSAGRLRYSEDGAPTTIVDPTRRVVLFLDDLSNIVLGAVPLGPDGLAQAASSTCPATASGGAGDPAPRLTQEDLGTREIEGVRCRGRRFRFVRPGRIVAETWISEEHDLVLMERRWSEEGEVCCRLFDLRPGEPDPALFAAASQRRRWWWPFANRR